jgi:hypothetical protein
MEKLKEKISRLCDEYAPYACVELYSDGSGGVNCEGEDLEEWETWEEFENWINKKR